MPKREIRIDRTWDGQTVDASAVVAMQLEPSPRGVHVSFEAPFVGDPAPPGPAGPTPGLWNHEVVELFLLGDDQRYLEIEVGPHGHHLALELHGVRRVVQRGMPLEYAPRLDGDRWRGRFTVPGHRLPPGLARFNAYAIRGVGAERRYLAAFPPGGEAPDFHRLDAFAPLGPGWTAPR